MDTHGPFASAGSHTAHKYDAFSILLALCIVLSLARNFMFMNEAGCFCLDEADFPKVCSIATKGLVDGTLVKHDVDIVQRYRDGTLQRGRRPKKPALA